MSTEDKTPMKRINFELDEELHAELKIKAAQERKTVKDFVTDLLEKALRDEKKDYRALA